MHNSLSLPSKKFALLKKCTLVLLMIGGLIAAPAVFAKDSAEVAKLKALTAQSATQKGTADTSTKAAKVEDLSKRIGASRTSRSLKSASSSKRMSKDGKQLTPREEAFEVMKERIFPLKPTQIISVHKLADEMAQAVATPPKAPPIPVSTSQIIHLDPGVTPPVIRLAAGYISSLVFVDSTGAPWPITAYGIGDPSSFNIQWDTTSNLMMIQSLKDYATGNLAVRLYGLPTPVTITLVSTQKYVDYRVDMQVVGRGPNASAPIVVNSIPNKPSASLISVLDGIPPKNSKQLLVSGDTGKAWLKDGTIYYRSKLTLLSPAWNNTLSSPDGMHVYVLPKTPLLLASKNGQTVKIHLSGF